MFVTETRAPGRCAPSVTDLLVHLVPDNVPAAAASAAPSAPSQSKFFSSPDSFSGLLLLLTLVKVSLFNNHNVLHFLGSFASK